MSESPFRALINSHLQIVAYDPHLRAWIEPSLKDENPVGQSLFNCFPALFGLEQELQSILNYRQPMVSISKINAPPAGDGSARYYDLTAQISLELSDHLLLIITDVSQQAQLEQTLRQERNELRLSIMERQRVEAALRESEARFRAYYLSLPTPTLSWRFLGGMFYPRPSQPVCVGANRGPRG